MPQPEDPQWIDVYNEGFQDAAMMGLRDDPEKAAEWFDARLRAERVGVLQVHRARIGALFDNGEPLPTALAALDDAIHTEQTSGPVDRVALDLTPFQQVLDELRIRGRNMGGGVRDAYLNSVSLLETAFDQYTEAPK